MSAATHEFSGLKGRFFAWFLTSPMRRLVELKMGKPEERLMELLALEGHERVLDAGCGSGFHSLLLADALTQGQVVSVDVSPEMLGRLQTLAARRGLSERIEVLQADGLDLPLPEASVDRALSAAVWHHLDDPQQACRELVRTLRPGGRAVVSDLLVEPSTKAAPGLKGHDRAFGAKDMVLIMETAGLQDVHTETVGRWVLGTGTRPDAP
jgi:ubiquinone/menaquinone biosynthesis C-methylase UbiE